VRGRHNPSEDSSLRRAQQQQAQRGDIEVSAELGENQEHAGTEYSCRTMVLTRPMRFASQAADWIGRTR